MIEGRLLLVTCDLFRCAARRVPCSLPATTTTCPRKPSKNREGSPIFKITLNMNGLLHITGRAKEAPNEDIQGRIVNDEGPLLVEEAVRVIGSSAGPSEPSSSSARLNDPRSLLVAALERIRSDLTMLKEKTINDRDEDILRSALAEPLEFFMVPLSEISVQPKDVRQRLEGSRYFTALSGTLDSNATLVDLREVVLERHLRHHLQFLVDALLGRENLGEEAQNLVDTYFGGLILLFNSRGCFVADFFFSMVPNSRGRNKPTFVVGSSRGDACARAAPGPYNNYFSGHISPLTTFDNTFGNGLLPVRGNTFNGWRRGIGDERPSAETALKHGKPGTATPNADTLA